MFIQKTFTRFGAAAMAIGLALAVSAATTSNSGNVLPPTAKPQGYSLDKMAGAVADFSISGNDPAYLPTTPFQILYRQPGNTFTVAPGTFLYVKFFFIDDSPPVIGDFPANKAGVGDYVFGRDQLGGHDLNLTVDGKTTSLDDPGYAGLAATPTSPDGSGNIVQIGAFVTPLNKGIHTITIEGVFDGDAIIDAFGGPFAGQITYTVIVK